MKISKVFDNGGATFDRYTIIFEGRHLGRQIQFADLPENVRLHIYGRIT